MAPISHFPDPKTETTPEGIIGVGGDLHPESLLLAYRQGIFPWPVNDADGKAHLCWFCPQERAILEFERLHISRSLERARKQSGFDFSIDRDFTAVINHCRRLRLKEGTWITTEMRDAYIRFHEMGYAHSAEVWENGKLVGGIYGISVDGFFAGESMFHIKPNASKLAVLHLVDHLRERGSEWIDIQMLTPHMERLGARVISRDDFLAKLEQTRAKKLELFP